MYQQNYNPEQQQAMPQVQVIKQSHYPSNANGMPESTTIQCPTCNKVGPTVTEYKSGSGTWKMCLILIITVGCCCVPFCVKSCKNCQHFCSNCGAQAGQYEYKLCR